MTGKGEVFFAFGHSLIVVRRGVRGSYSEVPKREVSRVGAFMGLYPRKR